MFQIPIAIFVFFLRFLFLRSHPHICPWKTGPPGRYLSPSLGWVWGSFSGNLPRRCRSPNDWLDESMEWNLGTPKNRWDTVAYKHPIGNIYHLYIAYWVIIYHIPPIKGTFRNSYWLKISLVITRLLVEASLRNPAVGQICAGLISLYDAKVR